MRSRVFLISTLFTMTVWLNPVSANEQIYKEDEEIIAHLEMLEKMEILKDDSFDIVEQEEVNQ